MARPAGLEPATIRLEGGCSIQLSYGRFIAQQPLLTKQPHKKLSRFASPSYFVSGCARQAGRILRMTRPLVNNFFKKIKKIG